MQLRLQQKGLLLVAVPLLFQVLLVGWLAFLLEQADQATALARHSEQILAKEREFSHDTELAINAFTQFMLTRSDKQSKLYFAQRDAQFRDLEELKKLIANDQRQLANFDRCYELHSTLFKKLDDYEKTFESPDALGGVGAAMHIMPLRKEGAILVNQMSDAANAFAQVENERSKSYSQGERGARERIRIALIVLISTNIAICVSLGVFFGRDITNRLNVIVENTFRLREGRNLKDHLTGSDEIAYLDKVFHEMSAEIQMTEEKRRTLDALKRDFANMISHDLRTPISATQTFLENVADGVYGGLSSNGKESAEKLIGSLQRLVGLVTSLLDLEKIESRAIHLNLKPVSAASVVEEAVGLVQLIAETKSVELVIDSVPQNLHILADGGRIVQVLHNLLSNALDCSPPKSKVQISCLQIKDYVEFRIADEGPGIPKEQQKAIFERYKQLDASTNTGKGFGLGLAICKTLVEQHNGTIGIDSDKFLGSVFWFRIPRADLTQEPQRSLNRTSVDDGSTTSDGSSSSFIMTPQ